MDKTRTITLLGGCAVIVLVLYLAYERHESSVATNTATANASSEAEAATYAVLGQTTENPGGGDPAEAPSSTLETPAPPKPLPVVLPLGTDNVAYSVSTVTGQAYNAEGQVIIGPVNTGFNAALATGGGTPITQASQ